MPPIPRPTPSTVRAIYQAYESRNKHFDSIGLSVGELGTECDRALWFGLHWCSAPEEIDGRKRSIFDTGDVWEERIVHDLQSIGVDVYGQQDKIRLVSGHVRGKCDGKAIGLPEAPKTEHLMEFKSSNDKNFKALVKSGSVKVAKPLHYVQLQLGMHMFGLSRGGYLVVNKNDDERYFERVRYDADFCLRILSRAERIIRMAVPPSPISDNPDFFGCRFCKHTDVCRGAWPRVNCRTCLHSTPEMGGDARWSCARWVKPLSLDEQHEGCPTHLFIPALVPGEQIDADDDAETVTYRLHNGRMWTDGVSDDPSSADNQAPMRKRTAGAAVS